MIACDRTVSCQRLLAGTRRALASFVLEHLQIPNVTRDKHPTRKTEPLTRCARSIIAEKPSPFSFLFSADPRGPSLAGVEPFEFGVSFNR